MKKLKNNKLEKGNISSWAVSQITPENKLKLIAEILIDIGNYYSSIPIDELRDKLEEKMNIGFKEHGALNKTVEEINKEIENEYLDLIGWSLARRYIKEKSGI